MSSCPSFYSIILLRDSYANRVQEMRWFSRSTWNSGFCAPQEQAAEQKLEVKLKSAECPSGTGRGAKGRAGAGQQLLILDKCEMPTVAFHALLGDQLNVPCLCFFSLTTALFLVRCVPVGEFFIFCRLHPWTPCFCHISIVLYCEVAFKLLTLLITRVRHFASTLFFSRERTTPFALGDLLESGSV